MDIPLYPELNIFETALEAREIRVELYFNPNSSVQSRKVYEPHNIYDVLTSNELLSATYKKCQISLPQSQKSPAEILMASLDPFTADGSLIQEWPAYLPDPGYFR